MRCGAAGCQDQDPGRPGRAVLPPLACWLLRRAVSAGVVAPLTTLLSRRAVVVVMAAAVEEMSAQVRRASELPLATAVICIPAMPFLGISRDSFKSTRHGSFSP